MLFICSVDGEIILTSPVASGRGELITNRHHQRDISESVSSLVEEVVELLGGTTQARQFIDRIKKAKRRYIRDQLTIIRTTAIKYSSDIIKKAMQIVMTVRLIQLWISETSQSLESSDDNRRVRRNHNYHKPLVRNPFMLLNSLVLNNILLTSTRRFLRRDA